MSYVVVMMVKWSDDVWLYSVLNTVVISIFGSYFDCVALQIIITQISNDHLHEIS